nr:hypothetical protein [Nocardiopsis sp. 90127]
MTAAENRLQKRHGRLTPVGLLDLARSADTPPEERLDVLTVIQMMRADLDMAEYAALDVGHEESPWTKLGRALGITRQGAERRWLRLMPRGGAGRDADEGRRGKRGPAPTKKKPQRSVASYENDDVFELTFRDSGGVTDDRAGATHVIIRAAGLPVATLAHATHPRFGVRGYTLTPPQGWIARAGVRPGYRPERLSAGVLDAALQQKMWVDPAEVQPGDVKRDPASWGTLDDLLATLKPLLKDSVLSQ